MISPAPYAATSGQVTAAATTITCTLPSYEPGDVLVFIVNSNNAQSSVTFSSAVATAVPVPSGASGHLQAFLLTPAGTGQSGFTVTGSASSVWTWWCGNYRGASTSLPAAGASSAIGNSTVSAIAVPEVALGWISTGSEVMISAAGVNSSATWTTGASTVYATPSGNAAMMVNAVSLPAGVLTGVPVPVDRGLSGTTRNQAALAVVLQQDPGGTVNLLSNPSFETGTATATGWEDEHTTATEAVYSLVTTGVTDGTTAQQFSYTGTAADSGAKTELFQSPVPALPGQYLTFSVDISGSLSKVYTFIGIEGFADDTYLSEADTNITVLTAEPVTYTVSYLCPPGTTRIAAYIQVPGIGPTANFTITMDNARLTSGAPPNDPAAFFPFMGIA